MNSQTEIYKNYSSFDSEDKLTIDSIPAYVFRLNLHDFLRFSRMLNQTAKNPKKRQRLCQILNWTDAEDLLKCVQSMDNFAIVGAKLYYSDFWPIIWPVIGSNYPWD